MLSLHTFPDLFQLEVDTLLLEGASWEQPALAQRRIWFALYGGFVFPGSTVVKNLPANAGDSDLIPGLGRSLGEGNAIRSSILAWKMDRGVWWSQRVGHD